MNISKIIFIRLGIFVLFFSILIFPSVLKAEKLEKVTMNRSGGNVSGQMPFLIAREKGFYQREGLNMELFTMRERLMKAALISGNLDYVAGGNHGIELAAAGFPIKLIFVVSEKRPTFITAKPQIKSIKELKGKTLGTGGSVEDMLARIIFKGYGLDPFRDVTMIDVGPGMKPVTLTAGSVDSVFCGIDDMVVLREKGFRVLARVSDTAATLSSSLTTSQKKIRENPIQVKKMVRVTLEALIYVKEKKKDMVDYIVKNVGIKEDIAKEIYEEHTRYYTKDGTVSDKLVEENIGYAKMLGLKVKDGIRPSDTYDFSFVEMAKKELGISP